MKNIATILLLAGLTAGCRTQPTDANGSDVGQDVKAEDSRSRGNSKYEVTGIITLNDRLVITILSSAVGQVYTLTTPEGKVLAEKISDKEISIRFPEDAESIKLAIAELQARHHVVGIRKKKDSPKE